MNADVQVDGNNNRVAGRDYYELNAVIRLSPEELRQLTHGHIIPCPQCEKRLIQPNARRCNHCLGKHRFNLFAAFTVLAWGVLNAVAVQIGFTPDLLWMLLPAAGIGLIGVQGLSGGSMEVSAQ